jgi:hypothetical protein
MNAHINIDGRVKQMPGMINDVKKYSLSVRSGILCLNALNSRNINDIIGKR